MFSPTHPINRHWLLFVHTGSIPSELGGLVALENLNLGNNLLTGECFV